ncbi:MAG: hypothetical protein Q8S00_07055 [Deltaproteobacteria bacterium]|nr:hypothetical protein [Deltaproteobacteria bacterium]MDZ4347871.1 hypothetical protein [Candidatus Binatia bacterium]
MNVILRKFLREQIESAQKGGEPSGIVRDPSNNRLIGFDMINEWVGLFGKQQPQKVA